MNRSTTILWAMLLVVLPWQLAWSQAKTDEFKRSFGARIGYGTGPDQFVIGAQAVLGRVAGFMRFAPSVDLGLGDNMTSLLLNADLQLVRFSPPGSAAGVYAGLGPAIALFDYKNDGSDTEIGLNGMIGLTFPMGRKHLYNLECRVGVEDMPDFRILLGVMLGGQSQLTPRTIEIRR